MLRNLAVAFFFLDLKSEISLSWVFNFFLKLLFTSFRGVLTNYYGMKHGEIETVHPQCLL